MAVPDVRRGLVLYGVSVGLAWVTVAMIAGPGPAAYVALSGDIADAGVFFGVWSLGAATGAFVGGRAMDRVGRRPVLMGAHLLAAIGFATAGYAFGAGLLLLFTFATVVLAAGVGGVFLTRVAAADLVSAAERGRAVAVVQVSALAGALVGPLLLVGADPLGAWLGADPRGFVWYLAPPLLLAASLVVFAAPEPLVVASSPTDAPPAAIPRRPLFAGIAAVGLSEVAMVSVMGVTGAALSHEGHGVGAIGFVLASHFLGMFGLSLYIGKIADRAGRRATILTGLVCLAAGGVTVAFVPGLAAFAAGLFLVGLGWSFAYLGGTVILSDIVPASRRARLLGTTDLATRVLLSGAVFGAGWWYASHGLPGLGLVAAAVVALPFALVYVIRERTPGIYEGPQEVAVAAR